MNNQADQVRRSANDVTQFIQAHNKVISLCITLLFTGLVFLRVPLVWTAGDFALPLVHASQLLHGVDPLATPPATASRIPYPLTASTFLIPFAWLPVPLVSFLIIMAAVDVCLLLAQRFAPDPWWTWLLLLCYVPLLLNLALIQWLPVVMLGLIGGLLLLESNRFFLAALVLLPLLTKAQLICIIAVPLVITLVAMHQWRALITASAGWIALFCLSIVLRPGWPFVWWIQTRPFTNGYQALIVAVPALGIPLVCSGLVLSFVAWRIQQPMLMVACCIVVMSLITPQRAVYESAVLIFPLALVLRNRIVGIVVIVWSWGLLLQPALGIQPDLIVLLVLFVPLMVGLGYTTWRLAEG